MGIRKQLFGEESNCKGAVPELSASQTMHTTNVVVSDGRTGQDHDGLRAGVSEAGTSSCTPDRNKYVVAGISEAGTSSSRGMFSPMATVTTSESTTPDDEKKYTHVNIKPDVEPSEKREDPPTVVKINIIPIRIGDDPYGDSSDEDLPTPEVSEESSGIEDEGQGSNEVQGPVLKENNKGSHEDGDTSKPKAKKKILF